MRKKTLRLTCNQCGKEVIRYVKIGKGNLIRCWKNRIMESHFIKKDGNVYCTCGNLIGIDKNVCISIKKHHINIE